MNFIVKCYWNVYSLQLVAFLHKAPFCGEENVGSGTSVNNVDLYVPKLVPLCVLLYGRCLLTHSRDVRSGRIPENKSRPRGCINIEINDDLLMCPFHYTVQYYGSINKKIPKFWRHIFYKQILGVHRCNFSPDDVRQSYNHCFLAFINVCTMDRLLQTELVLWIYKISDQSSFFSHPFFFLLCWHSWKPCIYIAFPAVMNNIETCVLEKYYNWEK